MATTGYTLVLHSPYSYSVGSGWYNYGFTCKGVVANTSYTSYRSYVRFAYWNGSSYILDTGPVALTLDGMAYIGSSTVVGYNQGQTVSMRAYFFATYSAASNFGSTGSAAPSYEPCADASITLPTVTVNYTITYNSNGATSGSPSPTSQTVASGSTAVLGTLGTAIKTGYHADGWAESASGAKSKDFEASYTVTGNKTFYLHWVANTYTVHYNGNGNTGGSTANSSHTYGVAKALTSNGFTRTGYSFIGWSTASGGSVVYTDGQSVTNLTTDNGVTIELYAVWEDTTEKASYIVEHVQNKAYRLRDGTAAHGTGTSGRVARWTASDTIANSWYIGSGAPPSTVTNGDIYVKDNSVSWTSDTGWVNGNGINFAGDMTYACSDIRFVSETDTTYTISIKTNSYCPTYEGGADNGNFSWSLKVNGTQIAGANNTWAYWTGGYLRSDSPGIYTNTAYVINKTDSAQTIPIVISNTYSSYGTSTRTVNVKVPPKGRGPAVGYDSAWNHSVVWVNQNGTWKKAQMWMNVNGTWTKAYY